ncbi:hypothetical protein ACFU99_39980 [Streptomyces sp. NPDC057654]
MTQHITAAEAADNGDIGERPESGPPHTVASQVTARYGRVDMTTV